MMRVQSVALWTSCLVAACSSASSDSNRGSDAGTSDAPDGNGPGVPEGLPTYFAFGLQSDASKEFSWMASAMVPWDYVYGYVNQGWQGWNQYPDGAAGYFPTLFMNEADSAHAIPVFSFYELGSSG